MAPSETYRREVRERTVALVFELVKTVSIRQAEVDVGTRPDSTSEHRVEGRVGLGVTVTNQEAELAGAVGEVP
jgi:hypothetical protein